MEWKYCVVEYAHKASNLILSSSGYESLPLKNCWNVLYSIPFDPENDLETATAFNGCVAWIEGNKAAGSKYLVMEMFFYN